jgi:hypothetical protein
MVRKRWSKDRRSKKKRLELLKCVLAILVEEKRNILELGKRL